MKEGQPQNCLFTKLLLTTANLCDANNFSCVETDNYFLNQQIGGLADSLRKIENEKRDLSDKFEFYSQQTKRLEYCIAKIEDIYARLEGK